MVWSFVKDKTSFLPKAYKDARLEFDKVNIGTNSLPPRTRTCGEEITSIMPFAVGRLYVKNNFDDSSKAAVSKINILSYFLSF